MIRLFWDIVGLQSDSYDIALRAIEVESVTSSRSTASTATARTTSLTPSSSRPITPVTRSAIPTTSAVVRVASSVTSSVPASRSTSLVGRALENRQAQTSGNISIVTGHDASEPFNYTITLPAGRYYIAGVMNDPSRTSGRSNVFEVVEGNDLSCLSVGSRSTTSSRSSTSITGGVMQTPGSANETSTTSAVSGGAIAGIVIGVIGGLAILAVLAFFCLKRRRGARGRGVERNRFSSLPSASSQDGGEYGQAGPPIAAAWRRNSDPDEKGFTSTDDTQNLPYAQRTETLVSEEATPSLGDRRRQAGPPTRTLTEKTSMQGFIGKSPSSNESSVVHSRSSSFGAGGGGGKEGPAGSGGVVGRSTSTRRKPVPSLGPELRGELERERKMSAGAGGGGVAEPNRKSYSLVPDLPLRQS